MIYDAQDGTSGRRVWRMSSAALPRPVHVIAATEQAARDWFAGVSGGIGLDAVEDVGSADRTEIALWRDESRL